MNNRPRNQKPTKPSATLRETAPQAFITISPDGEIAAWGLERELEQQILHLTGNRELVKAVSRMAYELCG